MVTSSTHPSPGMSLEEQRAAGQRYDDQAYALLIDLILEHQEYVTDLSAERLETIGFEEYGDEMWHQSIRESKREFFEEIADAHNRAKAMLRTVVERNPE